MIKRSLVYWSGIALAIFLCLWFLATIPDWSFRGRPHQIKGISTVFGIIGYTLLAFSFFLSSRWKKLENWVGGLDRIYHFHHRVGVWGFVLLLIHPIVLAAKWLPYNFERFFFFFLPLHGRWSVNLGSLALLLLIVLISITLLKLLRYDRWKITHKAMTLVFILATLHFILSNRKFSSSPFANMLLFIPMALGLFGIWYKQIYSLFLQHPLFEIIKTKIINDNVLEVTLLAKEKSLHYVPGQYAFISFLGPRLTRESHPFTILGSPVDRSISILVKSRGDFTRTLYKNIRSGYQARIEGPYGRFDYRKAGNEQIWIAGGIGIVPFLCWIRHLQEKKDLNRKIDLFYCVHRKQDAIFLEEFRHFGIVSSDFHYHLFCAEDNHHIDGRKLSDILPDFKRRKFLLCGPKKLTTDIISQLQNLGIAKDKILFEDFEFF